MNDLEQIRRRGKQALVAFLLFVMSWAFYKAGYTMGAGK